MKPLLLTALAGLLLTTAGIPAAQAGESSATASRVHSHCHQCQQPVYAFYRPVRYANAGPVFGWVPNYHARCCGVRTPAQVFNYGYGGRVTRYYAYPDIRSYNVYRNYPTTRAFSGFAVGRCR